MWGQRIDVSILFEQYKNIESTCWASDVRGKAAVCACDSQGIKKVIQVNTVSQFGFVWAKINGVYIFSCYTASSIMTEDFTKLMDRLVVEASCHKPTGIAGDFSAWGTELGSRKKNPGGEILLEAFAQMTWS